MAKEIKQGVNLYFLENENFKTNRVSFNFYAPLEEETASHYAVLTSLIIRANNQFKTTLEFEQELANLYGTRITAGYSKYGDAVCYSFSLDILKDDLAGEEIDERGLELLADTVLFQDSFDEEYFFQEKQNQLDIIHAKENEKKALALDNLVKLLAPDEPFSISEDGDLDRVAELNLENLIDFYQYKFQKLPCDIVCSGEFDNDSMTEIIEKIFDNYIPEVEMPRSAVHSFSEEKERIEKEDLSQSKLVMGFCLGDGNIEAKTLFNAIFGATPYSKLFVNIREKRSLCYYVGSKIDLFKNIMIVESGINKEDFMKTKNGILEELEQVKQGNFDEKDVDDAKRAVLQSLKSLKCGLATRELIFVKDKLLGEAIDEEVFMKLTREDIIAVANGIQFEALYLMESE